MQSHQVCTFGVLEDSALIRMIFSDKFVAALAKHTYPVQIEKDNQGWLYPADLGVERIGYRTDLADGKLPTKIDDPAVYDKTIRTVVAGRRTLCRPARQFAS